MSNTNGLSKLKGVVQHYQWGGYDFIPRLLGMDNKEHLPYAEYWLGGHDNAPATMENGKLLNDYIKQHKEVLGAKVQQSFGRLPYLLKLLDVRDMLSIQVHPDKESAAASFAEENKRGIPLGAPHRNYKDNNHKPELMMALDEFWLLHGFRKEEALAATLSRIPELAFMLPVLEQKGYKALYEKVMNLEQHRVDGILQPLLNRIIPLYKLGLLQKENPDFWAARAALTFNEPGKIDRGIFSIYLLNIVRLNKGEAVFQDAGILHAYLEGQNVEIMANSDNVLRGGLTPKHVDLSELVKHVLFEPIEPRIILGKPIHAVEEVFITPAPDFELRKITLSSNFPYTTLVHSTDIFLVLSGNVDVSSGTTNLQLKKGEALVAFCGATLQLVAHEKAEIYRASIPNH